MCEYPGYYLLVLPLQLIKNIHLSAKTDFEFD